MLPAGSDRERGAGGDHDHDRGVTPECPRQGTGHDVDFVTRSLEPDVAAEHEPPLFERWGSGPVAAGVPEADLADQWLNDREAALFCLVYPVVASRGMDRSG